MWYLSKCLTDGCRPTNPNIHPYIHPQPTCAVLARAAGFFKNRREKLSPALLDRFKHVIFRQVPTAEWEQVLVQQLQAGGMPAAGGRLEQLARMLVEVHVTVESLVRGGGNKQVATAFPEVRCLPLVQQARQCIVAILPVGCMLFCSCIGSICTGSHLLLHARCYSAWYV